MSLYNPCLTVCLPLSHSHRERQSRIYKSNDYTTKAQPDLFYIHCKICHNYSFFFSFCCVCLSKCMRVSEEQEWCTALMIYYSGLSLSFWPYMGRQRVSSHSPLCSWHLCSFNFSPPCQYFSYLDSPNSLCSLSFPLSFSSLLFKPLTFFFSLRTFPSLFRLVIKVKYHLHSKQ